MAHYLIAHLNGGRYGDVSILSPAGLAELHRPAVPMGFKDASYGMGCYAGRINGIPTVSHSGDTASFHADMVLVPESKWGIVLLMNGNNNLDPARISEIATGVTSLVMGKQPPAFVGRGNARPTMLMYVLIVLAVQVLGITRSAVLLRRWHREPERHPRGRLRIALRIVPPLVLNLLWALVCLVAMRPLLGTPLRALPVHVPDLGYTLLLSVGIALRRGRLRPVVVVLVLRKGRTPVLTGMPVPA